jgi:hypothetical protein
MGMAPQTTPPPPGSAAVCSSTSPVPPAAAVLAVSRHASSARLRYALELLAKYIETAETAPAARARAAQWKRARHSWVAALARDVLHDDPRRARPESVADQLEADYARIDRSERMARSVQVEKAEWEDDGAPEELGRVFEHLRTGERYVADRQRWEVEQ